MTPDTAAHAISNGRPAFETGARPRRSQTLGKCWGDRPQSSRVWLGFRCWRTLTFQPR
jgi:hypothetical protein